MYKKNKFYFPSMLIVGLLLFPISVVLGSFFTMSSGQYVEIWGFLWQTILPEMIIDTLILLIGVGILTFFLGTTLAWLVVMYNFPGKPWIEGALLLPMAMPGYVIGIVILDHWDFYGVVPVFLREMWGSDMWFPDIRATWAVILTLSLVLYPYVYIASRAAFKYQNQSYLDAARSNGVSSAALYWRVGLPLARPTIFAGMALVIMETLADMGTVGIFSYTTFTVAIYEAWQGLFQKETALQLAGCLMIFTFFLFYIGTLAQNKIKHFQVSGKSKPIIVNQLSGKKAIFAFSYPMLIVGVAFIYPFVSLVNWEVNRISISGEFVEAIKFSFNSVLVATLSALLILFLSVFVAYCKRISPNKLMNFITQFSVTGFVLPGTIIALGVLIPLIWIDQRINWLSQQYFSTQVGLILTGSIFGLILAHIMRFFAVGFFFADSGLSKVSPSMDQAGLSLGKRYRTILASIHFPLIKNSVIAGSLIVFIDVTKEMAATLILRPIGFETLATKIWELSSESYWQDASLYSLLIICIMLVPVYLLIYFSSKELRQ